MNEMKTTQDTISLTQLKAKCIIGIFDWERKKKQIVWIDLEIPCNASEAAQYDAIDYTVDYKKMSKQILNLIQSSKFFLIETLAEAIANKAIQSSNLKWVRVTVSKPGAVRFSQNVSVSILRHKSNGQSIYLSLGSNVDAKNNILECMRQLHSEFVVVKQSETYESSAIGPKNQKPYSNLVVEIQTTLSPTQLKKKLLTIEAKLGRKREKNKYAPRPIDLDIIFYGNKIIKSKTLTIPHLDTVSRPYVLLPMMELNPHFKHPHLKKTMVELTGTILDQNSTFKKL